jgi:hypothetical protein
MRKPIGVRIFLAAFLITILILSGGGAFAAGVEDLRFSSPDTPLKKTPFPQHRYKSVLSLTLNP